MTDYIVKDNRNGQLVSSHGSYMWAAGLAKLLNGDPHDSGPYECVPYEDQP